MNKKKWAAVLAAAALIAAALAVPRLIPKDTARFQEKAAALREYALADWMRLELGVDPAGEAGYAVFFSVSDGEQRARVFSGAGDTADGAWAAALQAADKALARSGMEPYWVKADVLYLSERVTEEALSTLLTNSREGFFRYGVALDREFRTAFLEAELNSAGAYDYEAGRIDQAALNAYLKETGRSRVRSLPGEYTLFQCAGWLCDEEDAVHPLAASGLSYGRRNGIELDAACAQELVSASARFLLSQVREDGSISSGMDSRFGTELEGENAIRHAGALWALACAWRVTPEPELEEAAGRAAEHLLTLMVERDGDTAYLLDPESGELKLGASGMAVTALAEYMDAFQTDVYSEACRKLGNGILSQLDTETGEFYHVLNPDFTRKEEFRTVYYDGEAVVALCRLYGLTGVPAWLEAAQSAADRFLEEDYTQYADHWVSLAMNELVKHVPERMDYCIFALQNVQENLEALRGQEASSPVYLELLLSGFEVYDRMLRSGSLLLGFDFQGLLGAVHTRAERVLDGFLFPECAMYLAEPGAAAGAFMARQDGFRIRMDDLQHNMYGLYLYWKNYEALSAYGMPSS